MNSMQIEYILKRHPSTRRYFSGIFSRDNLPKTKINGGIKIFVCNTDFLKGEGIHWVAFYFNSSKGEFFDPLSLPLFPEFKIFLNRNSRQWKRNVKRVQDLESNVCGFHVLYFLIKRCEGNSMESILKKFSHNYPRNDRQVTHFISPLARRSCFKKGGQRSKILCNLIADFEL